MSLFKERLFCPVCDAWLGDRVKNELFTAHCEECKTTFIWRSKKTKPEASLDVHKDTGCHCGRCGR